MSTKDDYYQFDLCGFSYPIDSSSSEAQLWFDRGLLQCFNLNHYEGVTCFEHALDLDPSLAIAHWGIAYGLSLDYNKIVLLNEDEKEKAYKASIEADRLAQSSSSSSNDETVKLLCNAIKSRFDNTSFIDYTTEHYTKLNQDYLNSMKNVYEIACDMKKSSDMRKEEGNNNEEINDKHFQFYIFAGVLYAEAIMQMRPWALWKDSSLVNETMEAKQILEEILFLNPTHPGACHFYIHLMEMSTTPEMAIPQSDILRSKYYDCGHLIHMASHIDMQVGRYKEAVISNQIGIETDLRYCEFRGYETMYQGYLCHNYHMLVWACLYDGQYAVGLEASKGTILKTPISYLDLYGQFLESYFAGKWHVWIRFGKWNEILAEPLPSSSSSSSDDDDDEINEGENNQNETDNKLSFSFIVCISTGLYAKGMAYAALGDIMNAEIFQKQFIESLNAKDMDTRIQHNVKCLDQFAIAKSMLQGEILFRKWTQLNPSEVSSSELHNELLNESLSCLRNAVELDDALPYDEPWGWMVPARHALAALLVEGYDMMHSQKHSVSCHGNDGSGGGDSSILRLLDEAEVVYRSDLELHPKNVWSLRGLENCLKRKSSSAPSSSCYDNEIINLQDQAKLAGERADIPIGASCLCALMQQKTYEDKAVTNDDGDLPPVPPLTAAATVVAGDCDGNCSKRPCV